MIALLNTYQTQYYSGTSFGQKTEYVYPEVNTSFSTHSADYLERDNVCLSFRGSLFNTAHLIETLELSPPRTDITQRRNISAPADTHSSRSMTTEGFHSAPKGRNEGDIRHKSSVPNDREKYGKPALSPVEIFSDLELIIIIYLKFGIEQTLRLLVGDYSFLLLDRNIKHQHSLLYVVQNPMGSVPLYRFAATTSRGVVYYFSGTLASKSAISIYSPHSANITAEYIQGGTYQTYHLSIGVSPKWCINSTKKYFTLPLYSNSLYTSLTDETQIAHQICSILNDVVLSMCMTYAGAGKRMAVIDCGDIGSRVIAEMVRQVCVSNRIPSPRIFALIIHKSAETALPHSSDGCEYVYITPELLCRHLPNIVECAESTQTADVMNCVAPYFISKHIRSHYPDIGCLFHGVGCAELFGNTELYSQSSNPAQYDMDMCRAIETLSNHSVKSIYRTLAADRAVLCAPFVQQALICFVMNVCPFIRKCLLNSGDMYLLHEVANILNPHIVLSKTVESQRERIRKVIAKCAEGDAETYLKDTFSEKYGDTDIAMLGSPENQQTMSFLEN